ncbi:hypothetical protein J6590_051371 [Homalodisca vitripennis]|nr:hypothetical protein J6590_051371 [Homalodisca vitripennis]
MPGIVRYDSAEYRASDVRQVTYIGMTGATLSAVSVVRDKIFDTTDRKRSKVAPLREVTCSILEEVDANLQIWLDLCPYGEYGLAKEKRLQQHVQSTQKF